jgi:hypothetical protein
MNLYTLYMYDPIILIENFVFTDKQLPVNKIVFVFYITFPIHNPLWVLLTVLALSHRVSI